MEKPLLPNISQWQVAGILAAVVNGPNLPDHFFLFLHNFLLFINYEVVS